MPLDVTISLYRKGEFIDLWAGPHLASTGKVKAIKLQVWLGLIGGVMRRRKMLQRIYGTSFEKKADFEAYLAMLEEAAKRDHRKLGTRTQSF